MNNRRSEIDRTIEKIKKDYSKPKLNNIGNLNGITKGGDDSIAADSLTTVGTISQGGDWFILDKWNYLVLKYY